MSKAFCEIKPTYAGEFLTAMTSGLREFGFERFVSTYLADRLEFKVCDLKTGQVYSCSIKPEADNG